MPLIERLMHWTPADSDRNILVHDFFAANSEVVWGAVTVAQVKAAFAMDAADAAEYDALVAQAPTGSTAQAVAQKALYVGRIHAVFILAEGRYPQYDTPAAVRAKLGI